MESLMIDFVMTLMNIICFAFLTSPSHLCSQIIEGLECMHESSILFFNDTSTNDFQYLPIDLDALFSKYFTSVFSDTFEPADGQRKDSRASTGEADTKQSGMT